MKAYILLDLTEIATAYRVLFLPVTTNIAVMNARWFRIKVLYPTFNCNLVLIVLRVNHQVISFRGYVFPYDLTRALS